MPKKRLTHQWIAAQEAGDKIITYYDKVESGLMLRITKTGVKSFSYRYYFKGKKRRFTVGKFPATSLAEARKAVQRIKGKVSDGIDPQAEKNKRRYAPKEEIFKDVVDEYIEKYIPTLRERTADEYKRHLDVYLSPLNSIPIKDITKNHVMSTLDGKAYKDDSPTMANRIRSTLSSVFSFAQKRGLVDENIVSDVPTYSTGKSKRDRFYDEDEINELWSYFDSFQQPTGEVFKMLLITGHAKQKQCVCGGMIWIYMLRSGQYRQI